MELVLIKLSFSNPTPKVRYVGEQNNCNRPKSLAKKFTRAEAEAFIDSPMIKRLNPELVPA